MFSSFELFGKEIGLYMIAALVGALLAGVVCCFLVKRRGSDYVNAIFLMLIAAIGVFVGAHILYAITNIQLLIAVLSDPSHIKTFSDVLNIFGYIFGGSVFYGGLLGGTLVGCIYIYKKKLDMMIFPDAIAVVIPLFHAFGRIGCFLGGCCYGIESEKFGLYFNNTAVSHLCDVPRFPVQLLESLFLFFLFIFLLIMYNKNKLKSKLIYVYFLIYSVGRFFIEFLRGDTIRGFLFGLSTSQLISILIFISVLTILIMKKITTKKSST